MRNIWQHLHLDLLESSTPCTSSTRSLIGFSINVKVHLLWRVARPKSDTLVLGRRVQFVALWSWRRRRSTLHSFQVHEKINFRSPLVTSHYFENRGSDHDTVSRPPPHSPLTSEGEEGGEEEELHFFLS
jgi:hypothetical protein